MKRIGHCCFFTLLLLALFAPAKGQDLRGDTIDIQSYVMRLDFTDFANGVLKANATLVIKAKMNNVGSINLDLLRLTVDSIKVDGYNPVYAYNDSVININLLTTLNTGDSATLIVFYHGKPLQISGDFGGFYWTSNCAFNIGVSFLSTPHNFGKCWFPCFDNFQVRSYHESYITTPVGMKGFGNGLLLDTTQNAGSITWHWKLNENIPSYLASVTVGTFSTLYDTVQGINGTLPVEIAVLDSTDSAQTMQQFAHFHEVFHNLEKYWGPYRWERVGYCMVPFDAGAMEHATNISFSRYFVDPAVQPFYVEGPQIMAHELSHHWFGDLVTCDSAAEMWLNEGWARYNEMLYFEYTYGLDSARVQWRENHQKVLQLGNINDAGYWALAFVPNNETYGTTTYDKGADAIHTLRYVMGDTAFFFCVQNYLSAGAWGNGSSIPLRDALMLCSDQNLNSFFGNWILSPGFTHLSIENADITPSGNGYSVHVRIRQRLKHAPGYFTNLPVQVSFFAADMTRTVETITVNGECTDFTTSLPFAPAYVAADFDENIQDAISDEWDILDDTGTYDFEIGLMELQIKNLSDSVLFRVEHNWIPADAMYHPIQGLHLDSHRYWTIGGVFDTTFKANGIFEYDGQKTAYLDSSFISNTEDSIVMMYRPAQDSDWALADSFYVNPGTSTTDAMGTVTVYNIKRGEYAFGIYDSRVPTDTNTRILCSQQAGITQLPSSPHSFKMFPNPADETVMLTFNNNIFNKVEVSDLLGKKILEQKILPAQNSTEIKLKQLTPGTYLITLIDPAGIRTTQKLVKE